MEKEIRNKNKKRGEKEMTERNKPVIETMINSAALALMTFGVSEVIKGNYLGCVAMLFAMFSEWFKYYGRHIELW